MGYLNTQLEKVASAVTTSMEKKAAGILSALGKVGKGIGRGIRGVGSGVNSARKLVGGHIGRNLGKYAIGGGLAGWGAYNYANTGKIDPETGLPVLARDRAFIDQPIEPGTPGSAERQAYADAFEDYKNKRGYYENMPWWQKMLPIAVGDTRRIQQEYHYNSLPYAPNEIRAAHGVYRGEDRPSSNYAPSVGLTNPEEVRTPEIKAAVLDSIYAQRPSLPASSPLQDKFGYHGKSNYHRDAYPAVWDADLGHMVPNPNYNPSKYGLK